MNAFLLVYGLLLAPFPFPSWTGNPEETLHWDSDPVVGFSVTGAYEYIGAVRHTPVVNCTVKAVLFFQWDPAENGRVYVYGESTRTKPGRVLESASYSGAGGMRWKRINLPEPVVCSAGIDFWTGVSTSYYSQEHPFGLDRGPIVRDHGGFIKVPYLSQRWYRLTDSPFFTNRNWNQRAVVSPADAIKEENLLHVYPMLHVLPSPVHDFARISYPVTQPTRMNLNIYDPNGSLVRTLVNGMVGPGEKTVTWNCTDNNGRRVAPGMYFCRLTTDRNSVSGRIVVLD